MAASIQDVNAVRSLVEDATRLLDWSAGSDSSLLDDSGVQRRVLPDELADLFRAAVDQAIAEHFELALRTLRGDNPDYDLARLLRELAAVGWTGALRDFKLGVLAGSGREEVMETARRGRWGGGGIRRRVLGVFLGALNSALDSLAGIPGVAVVKELKDFLEAGVALAE